MSDPAWQHPWLRIERVIPAVPDNDEISPGISWRLTGTAEALVNAVIQAASGPRVAFNTSPTDTAAAIGAFDEAAGGPTLPFRAGRPGIRPCVHQGAERRLSPGCGFAAGSRLPGPADQRIARRVFHDLVQRPTAVARGVFQLHADVDQRLVLPRHGSRRQVPFGMTRNSSGIAKFAFW